MFNTVIDNNSMNERYTHKSLILPTLPSFFCEVLYLYQDFHLCKHYRDKVQII